MRDIYELESRFFLALGHPSRLKIIEVLSRGSRCNCELVMDTGLKQSNLSRHIKELVEVGILRARRDGVRVNYEIADKRIFDILRLVNSLVKRSFSEK